jgi:predicted small metal-binding protein
MTSGETEDEVMTNIGAHAAQIHPDIELTPDLLAAVRGVIKDE